MKIKLDENLPASLIDPLRKKGHDVDTVIQENLIGQADKLIWQAAQKESRFLITQDLDFSDIRKFKPGTHAGILLLRLHKPGRQALINKVLQIFNENDVNQWSGAFIVATDTKLRIRGQ